MGNKRNRLFSIVFGVILVITMGLSGCSRGSNETFCLEKEDKGYQRGQKLFKEGRYDQALGYFLKTIDELRDAPESHLEAGRIYLEHLKDPISAIYHFRKFLEFKPNVEQSPMVRQMIERSKKEFARSLPGKPFESGGLEKNELMTIIQGLKNENGQLKREIVSLKKQVGAPQKTESIKVKETPLPDFKPIKEIRTAQTDSIYTVAEGDTLSRISYKVYGSGVHWEKIFNANQDKLRSPNDLKVGQVLNIPKAP